MNIKTIVYYLRAKLGYDESGQDLLEYALLVALIAIVCVGAMFVCRMPARPRCSSSGVSSNGQGIAAPRVTLRARPRTK